MTKNTSTPVKPPGSHAWSTWYTMTAVTATARRPSMSTRYTARCPRCPPFVPALPEAVAEAVHTSSTGATFLARTDLATFLARLDLVAGCKRASAAGCELLALSMGADSSSAICECTDFLAVWDERRSQGLCRSSGASRAGIPASRSPRSAAAGLDDCM
eukprot:scaffold66252_cov72-Phaeocystis_antarctica.AAC.4